MDQGLVAVIVISELISLILISRVLNSSFSGLAKLAISISLLIPIIGPVMYGLAIEVPPPNRKEIQALNRRNNLFRHTQFDNDFEREQGEMMQKIKASKRNR